MSLSLCRWIVQLTKELEILRTRGGASLNKIAMFAEQLHKLDLEMNEALKALSNAKTDVVLAVDISGSTAWYKPYYDHVRQLGFKYKPDLILAWDHHCGVATDYKDLRCLNRGGGTEPEVLLEFLQGMEEKRIETLVVVTDAQFGKLKRAELDRLNMAYSLKNVENLVLYFIGDVKLMTTYIEPMFYRSHMKTFKKGDTPYEEPFDLRPGQPLEDSDDLFSDEVLNRVVNAAKNYGKTALKEFRDSVLRLSSKTRAKDDVCLMEQRFASLCDAKKVDECNY